MVRARGLPLRSPSDTRGGVTFPCPHAAERLLTTLGDLFAPQCALTKQFFLCVFCFFSFIVGIHFKRNHFFGNETGIVPHIMHVNGYQWLSG